MSILEIIVTLVITWWTVLFFVLPFGNEYEENPATGLANSSPVKAHLKVKALITTGITLIITLIVYFILSS